MESFANSWYGFGLGILVTLGPIVLGCWAYQVEDENFCTVRDDATVEMMTACSTIGKFDRNAATCLNVLSEDGSTTNVVSQFNLAISIYILGFIGFLLTVGAAKFADDQVAVVGNLIAVSGLLSVISVFMMNKYRFINDAGSFCSGEYADDASLSPLHFKGHFLAAYLIFFWIAFGFLILAVILGCVFVGSGSANANNSGAIKIQNTDPKQRLLE